MKSLPKYTIGAKIFGAFVAMSAIIAILGAATYGVLSSAGTMAVTTFDGPLMAINYARAAQTDFTEMQIAELRYEHATAAERPAIAAEIADLASTFSQDLDVAAQRSLEADEKRLIREIRPLVARWRRPAPRGRSALEKLDTQVNDKFDLLIEFNTDHSFVGRRQTVDNINLYRYVSVGTTLFALLLAAGITLLLRTRIVRPLQAAATVADRIAKGELQTPIPRGGGDETGALLKSMTVMQDNIREMMTRETCAARRKAAWRTRWRPRGKVSSWSPRMERSSWPTAHCANSFRKLPIPWSVAPISAPAWRRCRPSWPITKRAASIFPVMPNSNCRMAAGFA